MSAELLNPKRALIFRITHRDNVAWLLKNGLRCMSSALKDPHFISIGNEDLIGKRDHRAVECPPGGVLSDYVPFYFTPFSPMLFNIKTGRGVRQRQNEEIVILVSSLPTLVKKGTRFVFTDRHAYLEAARFSSDLGDLRWIDWPSLQARDFKKDPDDRTKFERYQAEALVHQHLPVDSLLGIVCYDNAVEAKLKQDAEQNDLQLRITVNPTWYFR